MRNKWTTIAVVGTLATFGAGAADAQGLAGTLQKLRAETSQGLPLGMLAAGARSADSGTGRAAWRGQDLAAGRTVRSSAPPSTDNVRRNARGDGPGWSVDRAMGTLDCIGAVDQAVRTARDGSSSRIYRAQNIAWSAQWAQAACGYVVSGR